MMGNNVYYKRMYKRGGEGEEELWIKVTCVY